MNKPSKPNEDITRTGRIERPPPPSERTLIVGDGPVARALAASLERVGAPVKRWWRQKDKVASAQPPLADVVVLAVRDQAIPEVAARVMRALPPEATPPILLHCAGALPGEEPFRALEPRPLGVGLVHPLRSFAGAPDDADLAGVVFGIDGDPLGRDAALRLVQRIGGVPLELERGQLARYHAAAALVSNHAVALVDAGVELLAAAGLERALATRALAELLASTAANLREVGLPQALTGPIARGDIEVVARHLLALAEKPAIAAIYRATGRRVLEVAAEKGRASTDALTRLRALLQAPD